MDDNTSPQIGLDINPDLMTTQTGVPQAPFSGQSAPTPQAVTSPVASPQVEDITPRDISTASSPVQDITPEVTEPIADSASHLIDVVPHTPADLIEKPVTEIAPIEPTPAAPTPVVSAPPASPAPTSVTATPEVTPPVVSPNTPPTPVATAPIQVELPPVVPQNPLSENPDTVTLK